MSVGFILFAQQVAKYEDPKDACAAIVAESYRLWLQYETRTDDITIIIVHIDSLQNVWPTLYSYQVFNCCICKFLVSFVLVLSVILRSVFCISPVASIICGLLEFSSISRWLFVRSWLLCIEYLPCWVRLWCMQGDSVVVWTKNIPHWSIEG